MTEPIVAILGCGPAGMMAAHACSISGVKFAIFSRPEASRLGGAQFLHQAIPLLTSHMPDAIVNYWVVGDGRTYQKKAYGSGHQPSFVSFSNVFHGKTQQAWNLIRVYDQLWQMYSGGINEMTVTPTDLIGIQKDFDLVVSSIPRRALCAVQSSAPSSEVPNGHRFNGQSIRILKNQCALPADWTGGNPEMTIFYNGSPQQSWYRSSSLWGHQFTEFGDGFQLPYEQDDVVYAFKPLSHDCTCHTVKDVTKEGMPKVIFVGRYGQWCKGVLTHDAFFGTLESLQQRGLAK